MHVPAASVLLDAWERSLSQPPFRRPLAWLGFAFPDVPYESLLRLSIGRCDTRLLDAHELLFGPQLEGVSSCPHCREKIEMNFSVAALRTLGIEATPAETLAVSAEDYDVRFRMPTLFDLESVSSCQDEGSFRRELLARCVISANNGGNALSAEEIPTHVIERVVESMSQADPQAAAEIALSCPACTHQWTVAFDAGAFLWAEVHSWAQRVLREVHELARSYGWSESEVLALSPARRRAYLDLAQS